MEGLSLIIGTIIAVLGSFTALGFFFQWQLSPVKKDIDHLKAGQARFDSELKELKTGLSSLEKRMSSIEGKLDQLLARA